MKKTLAMILAIVMALPGSLLASQPLKKSTATTVNIGPFVDDTDFKTLETALTVTNMTVKLIKQSDTRSTTVTSFSPTAWASSGANDAEHVASAMYNLELTATNTDTAGRLDMVVTITGALPVFHRFFVQEVASWDSFIGGVISTIDDFWEYLLTNIGTAGGVGKLIKDFLDAAISSRVGAARVETAQAGGANTITLDASALASNNAYRGNLIIITGGTGIGQTALIRSYDGTTKVATISCYGTSTGNWHTNPDATSVYQIIPAR